MQKHFEINYLPLNISLTALEQAELPPFLGSTLRGVIGQSLLQTDKEASAYLYRNGEDPSLDANQVITKPYMIIPPEISVPQTIVQQGEKINFEFLLFGNASKYASSLILALEHIQHFGLGAYRYPFCLSEIVNSYFQRLIWRNGVFYKQGMNTAVVPILELEKVTGLPATASKPELFEINTEEFSVIEVAIVGDNKNRERTESK